MAHAKKDSVTRFRLAQCGSLFAIVQDQAMSVRPGVTQYKGVGYSWQEDQGQQVHIMSNCQRKFLFTLVAGVQRAVSHDYL